MNSENDDQNQSMLPKGSTIIIVFMYLTWIGYLGLQLWAKKNIGAFLPMEVTYGTAGLFIIETVSLARLKMAKEGDKIGQKTTNTFLQKLGIGNLPDFEQEAQQEQLKTQRKEGKHEQGTITSQAVQQEISSSTSSVSSEH